MNHNKSKALLAERFCFTGRNVYERKNGHPEKGDRQIRTFYCKVREMFWKVTSALFDTNIPT